MFQLLRQAMTAVYNTVYPPARKPIPLKLRHQVWEKYHPKKQDGVCYCCGVKLQKSQWHCSHVVSDKCGGKAEITNLRVCCAHCNTSMRKMNLYTYMFSQGLYGPGRQNMLSYIIHNPWQYLSKR